MSEKISSSMLEVLDSFPDTQPVALLLRHSIREELSPNDVGNLVPLTDEGRQLSRKFGRILGGRLRGIYSSPILRCVETAEHIKSGALSSIPVIVDKCLGDPSVFVIDGEAAWVNWKKLGHEGVVNHLVAEDEPLPGMAHPEEATKLLVEHILSKVKISSGIHLFITHDSVLTITASRFLGRKLTKHDWPKYLEGAIFWQDGNAANCTYREYASPSEESQGSPL